MQDANQTSSHHIGARARRRRPAPHSPLPGHRERAHTTARARVSSHRARPTPSSLAPRRGADAPPPPGRDVSERSPPPPSSRASLSPDRLRRPSPAASLSRRTNLHAADEAHEDGLQLRDLLDELEQAREPHEPQQRDAVERREDGQRQREHDDDKVEVVPLPLGPDPIPNEFPPRDPPRAR